MSVQVESGNHGSTKWADTRSKRTKAVPKHTLFGSTLERFNQDEMKEVNNIDMEAFKAEQERARQGNRRTRRQDSPRKSQQSEVVLQQKQADYAAQYGRAERADDLLRTAEERARYFSSAVEPPPRKDKDTLQKQSDPSKHLKEASLINDVGLQGSKAFNREKFRKRPPVHQYELMGDVLQVGMDLNSSYELDYTDPQVGKMLQKAGPKHGRRALPVDKEQPKTAIYLPPNIKHQFGTKICNAVLADATKVQSTIDRQKWIRESHLRAKNTSSTKSGNTETEPLSGYESLGNALRQNICPGYSTNHTKSVAKSDYNDDVHKNRVPDPDQWRCQRDELSKWNEHNVLYNRMKRRWGEYLNSQPKLQPNWDRDAKRPPPVIQPEQNKPKLKPKRPKEKKNKDDVVFEDVVFVTPPLTPPPPPLKTPPKPAPEFTRDDAFWKFYDQPLPH